MNSVSRWGGGHKDDNSLLSTVLSLQLNRAMTGYWYTNPDKMLRYLSVIGKGRFLK